MMRGAEQDLMQLFLAILVLRAEIRDESIDARLTPAQAIVVINRTLDQTFGPTDQGQASSFAWQHIETRMEQL